MGGVPEDRIRNVNGAAVNPRGRYVLYWMTAARRSRYNFALQRAVERARELSRPLMVLEALRCDYPFASDRFHRFIIEGMADNLRQLRDAPVRYFPYLETGYGQGKGLLRALARHACAVVTDDFPCFFIPAMVSAAGGKLSVLLEAVDSNGLLPMRATDRVFLTAASFRRYLHQNLKACLDKAPLRDPLARAPLPRPPAIPREVRQRWRPAAESALAGGVSDPGRFPIDHTVPPVALTGGATAGNRVFQAFVKTGLSRYAAEARHPDAGATSGLSPYLHFGHVSSHQVLLGVTKGEKWTPARASLGAAGRRQGFWGMGDNAEAFLDQLLTWRELGFNMCALGADWKSYDSLPDWARRTLSKHARDARPYRYHLDTLREARTHDPVWNAAQNQLLGEGRIHNYLRMLWGKKILQWTASPREALATMVDLNDRYALDGRDPNSYGGIFWVLGRYDRAWGPERPVFGTVRYMSSESTLRKLRMRQYLDRYLPAERPANPRRG